jgi:prophage maintenance system killer protein
VAVFLALADYFRIAEDVAREFGLPPFDAEALLANDVVVDRALRGLYAPFERTEAGDEVFPTLRDKAAALAFALMRERPLDRENVRVAHEFMKEFLFQNELPFDRSMSNRDPIDIWARIAAEDVGAFEELLNWVWECTS